MKQPTKEILEEVIIKSYGNITTIARSFDVSRTTIMNWVNAYDINHVVQQGRDHLLDIAEDVMARKIKEGDTATLIFFLKTQGKKRCYIERQELTGSDDKPLFSGVEVTIKKP
jgi:transposase